MILPNYSTFRTIFAPSATLDKMGYPVWDASLMRSGGFAALVGLPSPGPTFPVTVFPLVITCNAGAVDGGAAFDWYLSQRTDITTRQFLRCTQYDATRSGTVILSLTALALTALDIATGTSPVDEEQVTRIFRHSTLYCQRRSDQSIQLIDLLPTAIG